MADPITRPGAPDPHGNDSHTEEFATVGSTDSAIQHGKVTNVQEQTNSVTFDESFAQQPTIVATVHDTNTSGAHYAKILSSSASGFDFQVRSEGSGTTGAVDQVNWIAIG